jgi:FtsP/CotA-like multicopper oxidase with cupredoxin domain
MGMGMGMGMGTGALVIDGKGFAPDRTDINAKLGTTEEWTLRNNSMMDHPFHLHVWPFRVVSRSDGSPDPGWRDTVNVPAGGNIVIRVPFTDTPGRTVYHCHILDHEDLGMMGVIDVR